jgi:DNA-binding response OmpR family regulator
MTILVIEDSRFLQSAIDKALREAGYQTVLASDGEQGLQAAIRDRPDLILLDIMLPSMPGTSVLRSLRHNAITLNIPVIVLTGLTRVDEARLRSEGATGYMKKTDIDLQGGCKLLLKTIEGTLTTVNTQSVQH